MSHSTWSNQPTTESARAGTGSPASHHPRAQPCRLQGDGLAPRVGTRDDQRLARGQHDVVRDDFESREQEQRVARVPELERGLLAKGPARSISSRRPSACRRCTDRPQHTRRRPSRTRRVASSARSRGRPARAPPPALLRLRPGEGDCRLRSARVVRRTACCPRRSSHARCRRRADVHRSAPASTKRPSRSV